MPSPFENAAVRVSDLRSRVEAEREDTLNPGCSFSLKVSPAEHVRYEENEKLGEAVFEHFEWIAGRAGQVTSEEIVERFRPLTERLKGEQRRVITNVVKRILESLRKATPEYERQGKEVAESFYDSMGLVAQIKMAVDPEVIRRAVMSGMSEEDLEKLLGEAMSRMTSSQGMGTKRPEITMTKTGAFIMLVKDKEIFNQMMGNVGEGTTIAGGKLTLDAEALDRLKQLFPSSSLEMLNRMIVVADRSTPPPYSTDQVIRHELIHDLFGFAIQPELRTAYRDPVERRIFENVKNELLAYLLANCQWRTNLNAIAGVELQRQRTMSPDTRDVSVDQTLFYGVMKSRMSGPAEKDQDRALRFMNELFSVQREVAKLQLLDSHAFYDAAAIVMTAQSLKEIAYRLSDLSEGMKIFVSPRLSAGGLDLDDFSRQLMKANEFLIPLEGVENIRQAAQRMVESEEMRVAKEGPSADDHQRMTMMKNIATLANRAVEIAGYASARKAA